MGIDMFTSVLLAVTDKVAELVRLPGSREPVGHQREKKGARGHCSRSCWTVEGCQGGGERGEKSNQSGASTEKSTTTAEQGGRED